MVHIEITSKLLYKNLYIDVKLGGVTLKNESNVFSYITKHKNKLVFIFVLPLVVVYILICFAQQSLILAVYDITSLTVIKGLDGYRIIQTIITAGSLYLEGKNLFL